MRLCSLFLVTSLSMLHGASATAARAPKKLAPPTPVSTVTKTDIRTGRTVTSIVIQPRAIPPRVIAPLSAETKPVNTASIGELVLKTSSENGVDPLLVNAIIHVESGYNPNAVSPVGAEGLMQLMPETGRRWGARNAFDPEDNIRAGVKYLRYLQERFKDDRLALAAYNAGENAVDRYGWIPPYRETVEYVYKVGKKYGENRRAATVQAKLTPPPPKPEAAIAEAVEVEQKPAAAVYRPVEYYVDNVGKLFLKTR